MSAFDNLASPAPKVDAAAAAAATETSDSLRVDTAQPSESVRVEAAKQVEPAVLYDDPKKFAPPITPTEARALSVSALRGSGADFECEAAVIRGPVQKNFLRWALPLCFDERDFVSYGEVARFLFVKSNCIFVYGQETDSSPLYLIGLEEVIAEKEDPKNPDKNTFTVSPRVNTNEAREHMTTILLRDRTKQKIRYQISFDTINDRSLAKRFLDVIRVNAKRYNSGVVEASVMKK